jgi:lysophospholipase L1-like esterase
VLGSGYRVIEEGLSGRTVATDSWILPHRDGRSMLGPLLESHAPLDWVIILLGINDCGPTYRRDASEIAFGCATLLWTVQKAFAGPKGGVPQMLLISPPPFGKFSPFMELFFRGGEETARGLAAAYATVAEACGARFLDAASILPPGPVDGVNPDANGHRQLGEAIGKLIATRSE